jgi:hypothetical protein
LIYNRGAEGGVKGRRKKISLSEHNMDIQTYRAKVKAEGGNFERVQG